MEVVRVRKQSSIYTSVRKEVLLAPSFRSSNIAMALEYELFPAPSEREAEQSLHNQNILK